MNRRVLASATAAILLTGLNVAKGDPCQSVRALPPGFSEEVLATFSNTPATTIQALPDSRFVVGTGDGRAYLMDLAGNLASEPFVDYAVVPYELNGNVVTSETESGVLGCAVSPTFESDRHVYLYHTTNRTGPGGRRLQISRFTLHETEPTAEPASEVIIIDLADQSQTTAFHSGGGLSFGPDGKLYWSLGDDGNVNAPGDLNNVRGKILRLNPDGTTPTDNPFHEEGGNENRNRVYALGLRNPYRTFFDVPRNRQLVTDTGQARWEELNVTFAGAHHGWTAIEGPISDNPGITPPTNYADPFWSFRHGRGTLEGISIVAAIPYYGAAFPAEYSGDYFATEWGYFGQPGKIFRLHLDEAGELEQVSLFHSGTPFGFADMTVDANGNLVYTIANFIESQPLRGQVRRIVYTQPDDPPFVSISASVQEGPAPLAVQFDSIVADDTGDPAFCWNFPGIGTSQIPNPLRTFENPGVYTVTFTAEDTLGSRTVESLDIRVYATVDLELSGMLHDAGGEVPLPLDGTVELFQPDGTTTLLADPVAIPGGMIDVALPPTELFGNRVIAEFAAPGFPSRRVSLSGGQLSGQHFDVYMSPAAITGNVTTSTGVDAGGTDLFVQVERDGVLQPYAIPGGFDYSPPLPPTGVPHGTLAAPGGAYYFPIRTEDLPAKFEVTANAQRNLAGFLSASGQVIADPGGGVVNLELTASTGTAECQEVFSGATLQPSFAEVQAIFNQHCIGCHGLVSPNADLSLAEGFAYSSIVDVLSKEDPSRKLIDTQSTGDPVVASWLMEKVRCSQPSVGSVMPPTGKLTGQEINVIGYWARRRGHFDATRTAVHASSTEVQSPSRVTLRGGAEAALAPFTFQWDFGNGLSGSGPVVDANFAVSTGTLVYTATVDVFNREGGFVGASSVDITVTAPEPDPENNDPIVELELVSINGLDVEFAASATDPDGDAIVLYGWDIDGDGVTDQFTETGILTFTLPGQISTDVRVRAYDSRNGQGLAIRRVPFPTDSFIVY